MCAFGFRPVPRRRESVSRAESRSSDFSFLRRLPDRNQWPEHVAECTRRRGRMPEFTAAGTVRELHPIPFSSRRSEASPRRWNSRHRKNTKNFSESGFSRKNSGFFAGRRPAEGTIQSLFVSESVFFRKPKACTTALRKAAGVVAGASARSGCAKSGVFRARSASDGDDTRSFSQCLTFWYF